MDSESGFDTVAVISALESTTSLFSGVLQLASMAFQFVPGMAGVAGVFSGVSSAFDNAGKVLDGVDKVRDLCDQVLKIYDEHPDPAAHPQVSDALMAKAFILLQNGRFTEALSVYDDLVRRFGADDDPAVARSVSRARINATGTLNKLQRFGETLPRYGEIMDYYGTDPDPAVVVDVMSARLNRMEALAELGRTDEALTSSDEIVSMCNGFDSGGAQDLAARIRQDHVTALSMKSIILLQQEKFDDALAASDEIIERFGADQHPAVRNGVTVSLLARAAALHHFGRWQEELDAYNKILAANSEDQSLQSIALNAQYGRIQPLLRLGRFQDAVHACDEIDRQFGDDPDLLARQKAARALLLKGNALVLLQRWDDAAAAMGTVVTRCGEDADPVLMEVSARAREKLAALSELNPGAG